MGCMARGMLGWSPCQNCITCSFVAFHFLPACQVELVVVGGVVWSGRSSRHSLKFFITLIYGRHTLFVGVLSPVLTPRAGAVIAAGAVYSLGGTGLISLAPVLALGVGFVKAHMCRLRKEMLCAK